MLANALHISSIVPIDTTRGSFARLLCLTAVKMVTISQRANKLARAQTKVKLHESRCTLHASRMQARFAESWRLPRYSRLSPTRRPATPMPSTAKRHDAERRAMVHAGLCVRLCASLPRFAGLGGDDGALKPEGDARDYPESPPACPCVQQCALGVKCSRPAASCSTVPTPDTEKERER